MKYGLTLFAAFSAAVFLAVCLLPLWVWPWLGLACLVPAGLFAWRRRTWGVYACLGAAAALLWCGAYRAVVLAPAEELDGRRVQVDVTLAEAPTSTDYGVQALCYVLRPKSLPVKALLTGRDDLLTCGAGDRVTLTAHCFKTAFTATQRVSAGASRGEFLCLTAQGAVTVDRAEGPPWWSFPRYFGQRLAAGVEETFPADVSGLVSALIAGDRTGLDDSLWTDLDRAGVAHLVAVSGMHVCFLLGFLALFTGQSPRRRALLGVPAALFFALAVGASPSVLRACVIQGFLLLAPLLGRERDRWTSLAAALALLLTVNPLSACNTGLRFSFAAVVGIYLVTPRLLKWWKREGHPAGNWTARLWDMALELLTTTVAVTLGALTFTVPLSAYYFRSISLVSPLANLLILPVASLFFAGALATGLVALMAPAAAARLAGLLTPVGRYILWVIRSLASLPYSAVKLEGVYYPLTLLGAYALLLIALLWRGGRRRWWVFVGGGGALLLGAVFFTRLTFCFTPFTAAVLDVGQGQSVVLRSAGETALVDCGGSGRTDPGDVAADYLLDRGERTVDKLLLTHYHADHTNGLDALFRRLRIQEVILPAMEHDEETQTHILELAHREGAQVTWLERDTDVTLGDIALTLYAPLGDGGANEEGLSVLVSAGDFHMLLTGDMNTTVEERLVKYGRLPRCQVLLAGHHGSRYASGDALLDAIRPQNVLISVGANTYGHPADATLDRLTRRGIPTYRTDLQGTLTVSVTP